MSSEVFFVPLDHAFQAVLDITRLGQTMVLARVDYELGRDVETPQCLIHLLRIDQWHVEVELTAHEKRRRLDSVGMEKRIRHSEIGVRRFPRMAEFVYVIPDILVSAVPGDVVRGRRSGKARYRRLELWWH